MIIATWRSGLGVTTLLKDLLDGHLLNHQDILWSQKNNA